MRGVLHNREAKNNQMVQKIKTNVDKSAENKMRLRAKKYEINVNQCKIEPIKRQIKNARGFEKKMEKEKMI